LLISSDEYVFAKNTLAYFCLVVSDGEKNVLRRRQQVACWCIGEYGASLLDGISIEGETLTVSEDEVIEVYQKILWAKHMSLVTKQYALMSVTKLSTRCRMLLTIIIFNR
jgi:hypothetical protein